MKKKSPAYIVCFLILLLMTPIESLGQQAYQIFDAKGKKADIHDLLKATKGKSHIFFGELHNSPIAHWLQLEITKALHETYGDQLILGAEMFETDNQLIIDEYFDDLIQQARFEAECRLWDNYETDYKPILEYAKEEGLRFIATNIPRRYANAVYHGGLNAIDALSQEAHRFIAPLPIPIDTSLTTYKEIHEMSKGHTGSYMLEAQAVKDATMAHFILRNSRPGSMFFHLNGAYHTRQREGIIAYLSKKIAGESILTITCVEQEDTGKLTDEHRGLGDFTVCIDKDMTKTY